MRPGRAWYLLSVGVFLAGAALAGLDLFRSFESFELPRLDAPGKGTIELQPGRHTVFLESGVGPDGRVRSASLETVNGLVFEVWRAADAVPVPVGAAAGRSTYQIGGREGVSVWSFQIEEAGTYEWRAGYEPGTGGPDVFLAVGHEILGRAVGGVLRFVGLLGAGVVGGVAVAGGVWWWRRPQRPRPGEVEGL